MVVGMIATSLQKYPLHKLSIRLDRMRRGVGGDLDLISVSLPKLHVSFLVMIYPISRVVLRILHGVRCSAIEKQLPEMMNLMGGALKAGLSFQQSIEMASVELRAPIGDELGRVIAQIKLGQSVEDALSLFGERIPLESVELMIRSIAVLRRSGGNMIEMFELLTKTIEGREKVSEKIRVLTAQGVFQGLILLAMPWALCTLIYFITPEYVEPLISTRLGVLFLLLAIMFELIGALWLRRIVFIKV